MTISQELLTKCGGQEGLDDIRDKVNKYSSFLESNFDDLVAQMGQSQELSVFERMSFQDGNSGMTTPFAKSQVHTPLNKQPLARHNSFKNNSSIEGDNKTTDIITSSPLHDISPPPNPPLNSLHDKIDYVQVIDGFKAVGQQAPAFNALLPPEYQLEIAVVINELRTRIIRQQSNTSRRE